MTMGEVVEKMRKMPEGWYTTSEIAYSLGCTRNKVERQLNNEFRYYGTVIKAQFPNKDDLGRNHITKWKVYNNGE
jgi:hypothetical protein